MVIKGYFISRSQQPHQTEAQNADLWKGKLRPKIPYFRCRAYQQSDMRWREVRRGRLPRRLRWTSHEGQEQWSLGVRGSSVIWLRLWQRRMARSIHFYRELRQLDQVYVAIDKCLVNITTIEFCHFIFANLIALNDPWFQFVIGLNRDT